MLFRNVEKKSEWACCLEMFRNVVSKCCLEEFKTEIKTEDTEELGRFLLFLKVSFINCLLLNQFTCITCTEWKKKLKDENNYKKVNLSAFLDSIL